MTRSTVRSFAPGRVNLIGDHTDYMGGLAMPMAIQMGTTVSAERISGMIRLNSDSEPEPLSFSLPVEDPGDVAPSWGAYVAGVAAVLGSRTGIDGTVTSTLPIGSGLSSSASLEVSVALALGDQGTPLEIAQRCQQAEMIATGVPCGIMDQLAITSGVAGHGLLMDFSRLSVTPVRIPDGAAFWVVHSGESRKLASSRYAQRRAECEAAEQLIGPLPDADPSAIRQIADEVIRSRALHVTGECKRVREFASALQSQDMGSAGALMRASHDSLKNLFEVSTASLDRCVEELCDLPGVYGARLTGAGFGGCVVALADPDVELPGWRVTPSDAASLL